MDDRGRNIQRHMRERRLRPVRWIRGHGKEGVFDQGRAWSTGIQECCAYGEHVRRNRCPSAKEPTRSQTKDSEQHGERPTTPESVQLRIPECEHRDTRGESGSGTDGGVAAEGERKLPQNVEAQEICATPNHEYAEGRQD